MANILPYTTKEVFIPAKNEVEIENVEAIYDSLSSRPRGKLVVTSKRVAFLMGPVANILVRGNEFPLRLAKANISFSNFVSATFRTETSFIVFKKELVEVSYETPEGYAKKAIFQIQRKGVAPALVETIKAAAVKYSNSHIETELPYDKFMDFVEYLSVEKSIRPLYYDSVSRCIAVGSSYFCINKDWEVTGSSDIINKAKDWIKEFVGKA